MTVPSHVFFFHSVVFLFSVHYILNVSVCFNASINTLVALIRNEFHEALRLVLHLSHSFFVLSELLCF